MQKVQEETCVKSFRENPALQKEEMRGTKSKSCQTVPVYPGVRLAKVGVRADFGG